MSETLKSILKEFEEHKGEFVITMSHKIEQFVGIGTDDDDYYWITYNGRKLTWNTCVGRLIYMNGKLDDKDYNSFVRSAEMNFYNKVLKGDELDSHLTMLRERKGRDKLLSELLV